MTQYVFDLHDGRGIATVGEQLEFPGDEAAFNHGQDVVRDLMRNRYLQTRSWRLDIFRANGECVAQLPFAQLDPTLDHLISPARALIERWSQSRLALAEEIAVARATIREARALVAQSRGKPYVVAVGGRTVWSDRSPNAR